MIEKQGTIKNAYGIHCRPADVIRKSVEGYEGKIELINQEGIVATPHKVLSILTLALTQGDQFTVRVSGPNEEEVCDKLLSVMESAFDFSR